MIFYGKIIMKKTWALINSFLCLVASPAFSADQLVVLCDAQQWTGQRIGFQANGKVENDENFQSMKETLFVFDTFPPKPGDRVFARFGEDNLYEGEVRYLYQGSEPYITIETKPYDLLEIYSIDLMTGNTIFTVTKQSFGFYKDVFTGQCDVRIIDPQK